MASFAKLGENNQVLDVVSVHNNELLDDNKIEQETKGIDFLTKLTRHSAWKQTSYNTQAGVHKLGGTPFRKNYAAIGYTYDQQRDAFIPPKFYNSWIINEITCIWEPPIPMPTEQLEENTYYIWDEETVSWKTKTFPKI
jgi:hypothetical protein